MFNFISNIYFNLKLHFIYSLVNFKFKVHFTFTDTAAELRFMLAWYFECNWNYSPESKMLVTLTITILSVIISHVYCLTHGLDSKKQSQKLQAQKSPKQELPSPWWSAWTPWWWCWPCSACCSCWTTGWWCWLWWVFCPTYPPWNHLSGMTRWRTS